MCRASIMSSIRVLLILGAVPAAWANWSGSYISDSQFSVNFSQVPDLDQRRSTLPNNGAMYCVPTSAMNWMAYIANHGYPNMAPFPHDWQDQSNYALGTIELSIMGTYMGTDPFDGTGGGGAMAGIVGWLPDGFAVVHEYAQGFYAPSFRQIAGLALGHALVEPVVGWYQGTPPSISRHGGHALTLTKAIINGGSMQIGWRDPADDSADLNTQSTFVTQTYPVQTQVVVVNGNVRAMDKIVNYGSAYLDEYFAIYALFGLTTTPEHLHLVVLRPFPLANDQRPPVTYFPTGNAGPLRDITLHADGLDYYYITGPVGGGPSAIWRFDPAAGQSTPIMSLPDAKRLVFGRSRELYVLDGRIIHRIDLDANPPQETHITPDYLIDALAYDDAHDRLLALTMASRRILMFDRNLATLPAVQIPAGPVLTGDGSVDVNPLDGAILFTSSDAPAIYRMIMNPLGGYSLSSFGDGSVSHARGLNVTDHGGVIVSCDGSVRVFTPVPGAGWQLDPTSPFAGLPAGDALHIPRSRTNFDPATMSGPDYVNILPTQFSAGAPDRPGDVNCDGVVDFADIDPFVAALDGEGAYYRVFPTCNWLNADANGDGRVDFADIDPFVGLLSGGNP